ncbi:hypothetical protein CERZMDRAFT_101963 [Cercospora zeae-maydis SCOH1-5]|uniref:Zn(2)-C6 fungal-type domain-containing protein n=1 Tax=Cercospora zeae-maydis SCOH1-5 TaxID=717836 RepID=A0A6A6F5U1_9PEZI|nr:hypothetical protein CERZMDRAFT_101963 [Cercospora zeae-maydis SCOH1-5]
MCNRCNERRLACEYDVREGVTKRQQIQYDLVDKQIELEHAMKILSHLQQSSDHEATESLARLRLGSSIEDEYRYISSPFSPFSLSESSFPAQHGLPDGKQHNARQESFSEAKRESITKEAGTETTMRDLRSHAYYRLRNLDRHSQTSSAVDATADVEQILYEFQGMLSVFRRPDYRFRP